MRAHSNLVLQVIKSQAGTLDKAIGEGFMNSYDQGAKNITIDITSKLVRIVDDGRGFAGQVVKDVFEEFGNPHPMDEEGFAKDTTFGKFRIGRGQMFAFGKNTWRSANFKMVTDVDKWGLDYDYEEGHPNQPGCIVEIELYDALSLRDIQHTVDRLTKFCRYTDRNLVVNGKSVATDPATLKWDVVNDLAYIKKKVVEHRYRNGTGLDVYQQGVFVESLPLSEFGLEGVIVIRQEVSVNFARNQVLRRCARWKKIAQLLKEEGIRSASNKKKLNRQEARNFVEEYAGGGSVSHDMFYDTACLPDVTGKLWSPHQLYNLIHTRSDAPKILRDADGRVSLCFGPKGDHEAEKVMQLKRAVVLDEVVLEWLHADDIDDPAEQGAAAIKVICEVQPERGNAQSYDRFRGMLIWADYRLLLEDVDDRDYHRLSPDEYTQREEDFIRCIENVMSHLDYSVNGFNDRENRSAGIGQTDLTKAWTDGASHITFDRNFVASLNLSMERDWFKAGLIVADMYAFTSDSTTEKDDSVECLQRYAEFTESLPDACRKAYQVFINIMLRRGGKLPKPIQENMMREAEAYAHEQHVYQDEEAPASPHGVN